ncbi:hypothetical protein CANINC_000850 [Pichia inconspicua]|uniref:DNA ligase n=1 Tax=Pichia inconspicua TaxID=52247 RepID=A0A4T0X632_9ASCO|nr:hypothetical protein CANINC_000850 [[Candida] inconspicua]
MSGQSTLMRFFTSKNKPESGEAKPTKKRPRSRSSSPSRKITNEENTLQSIAPAIKRKSIVDLDDEIEKHRKQHELEEAKELLKLQEQEKIAQEHKIAPAPNKPLMYSMLTSVFEELENESGRLKNIACACQFFKDVLEFTPADAIEEKVRDLTMVIYLMVNRLGPDYVPGLELGLGETLLLKALAQSTGREVVQLRKEYHVEGDIGVIAQKSRSKQRVMFKPKRLTVLEVWKGLNDIAKAEGSNSQQRKIGTINKLLTACEGVEAKFLMRSLEGKLRINFGEKSVIVALAKAILEWQLKQQKKKVTSDLIVAAEEQLKEAFCQVPNYEILIKIAMKEGILCLMDHVGLKPSIPLKSMLAKPTKSISEILDTLQGKRFTCEYKYDGERAQLHLTENGDIFIYSRNSENMTERYPDLVPVVDLLKKSNTDIKSLILDCECVAWDLKTEKILPFQILSTRKRKDVQEKDIQVQVCLFAFDILYYNGESLIQKPLSERRKYLFDNLKTIPGKFQFATKMDTDNVEAITKFLDDSVHDACEGLMIKTLDGKDSWYEPSKRSRNWLKLKKDYLDGVGDSLDLVVVGGYIGKGKRTGWYGGFLLAAYNQDTGDYETVCKIGTGFSEELLQKLHDILKPTEIEKPKPSYVYDTNNSNAKPDVWFEPTTLFEVKIADLTTSPIYKCGATYIGDGQKGISLRFPRFIQLRTDKSPEDATSSDQIVEMYNSQANLQ